MTRLPVLSGKELVQRLRRFGYEVDHRLVVPPAAENNTKAGVGDNQIIAGHRWHRTKAAQQAD